jgi:hypothetical protein
MVLSAGSGPRNGQGCASRKPLSDWDLWALGHEELGLVSGFRLSPSAVLSTFRSVATEDGLRRTGRDSSFRAYAVVAGRRKRSTLGTSM